MNEMRVGGIVGQRVEGSQLRCEQRCGQCDEINCYVGEKVVNDSVEPCDCLITNRDEEICHDLEVSAIRDLSEVHRSPTRVGASAWVVPGGGTETTVGDIVPYDQWTLAGLMSVETDDNSGKEGKKDELETAATVSDDVKEELCGQS